MVQLGVPSGWWKCAEGKKDVGHSERKTLLISWYKPYPLCWDRSFHVGKLITYQPCPIPSTQLIAITSAEASCCYRYLTRRSARQSVIVRPATTRKLDVQDLVGRTKIHTGRQRRDSSKNETQAMKYNHFVMSWSVSLCFWLSTVSKKPHPSVLEVK